MRRNNIVFCALACIAAAPVAAQVTFVEEFTGGSNTGDWTYFAPSELIESSGGNPGAYLHAFNLDTTRPRVRTTTPSVFTGDYRARQVSSVGIDLITHSTQFPYGGDTSVLLYNDGGTPGQNDDDWAFYRLGDPVPPVGGGWVSYDFDIPSQAATPPAGWEPIEFGPNANPDWNVLMGNVTSLGYFYGDPSLFYIFDIYDIGADNPRITYIPEPATLTMLAVLGLALVRRR